MRIDGKRRVLAALSLVAVLMVPSRQASAATGRVASLPTDGYSLVGSDGSVFSFGTTNYGSAGGLHLTRPIVGMATTLDGGGYWLVASDGGVFSFGDAKFRGSTGSVALQKPIVGMALDPATGGYWMVASDGGIFSFGAPYYGSTGNVRLTKPIVGMAATADGKGYWLVASDGGVFSFGDARFHGSTGGIALQKPIVGMALDPATGGYWMVASDGGIFSFDAEFYGSTGAVRLTKPIVNMATTPDGRGYWLAASDGGLFTFGDAQFDGSTGRMALSHPIVGMIGPGFVARCTGSQVGGDPYSPQCTGFEGNNGGSTSAGVSRNTITLAYRLTNSASYGQAFAQLAGAQLPDSNSATEQTITALVQYINAHFQFYGRQLRVEFYNGQGSLENELQGFGQSQASTDAATVAGNIHAFADISAESAPYADALVARRVMAFGDPNLPLSWHQHEAPYAWSTFTDSDWVAEATGNYAVQKLCGGDATLAGGTLQGKPRTFALIEPTNELYSEAGSTIQAIMTKAGCAPTVFRYALDLGTESQQAANLAGQLSGPGYTTVICACDPVFPVYLSGQAGTQGYDPEFIETGIGSIDQDYVGQVYNQSFYAHAFGVSPSPAPAPVADGAGYRAYKDADSHGTPAAFVNVIYEQLEQLAIGIQMAGPHLTPTTFETGMFNYPAHDGGAGSWAFSKGQFTAPNDVREVCWGTAAVSPFNERTGAYVGTSNQRWQASGIPSGSPGCAT